MTEEGSGVSGLAEWVGHGSCQADCMFISLNVLKVLQVHTHVKLYSLSK